MVRVDADGVRLEVEGVLAVLDLLQLVLVQVGPPPNPGVDHVWKPLATWKDEGAKMAYFVGITNSPEPSFGGL